jgi:hypothetical protein
MLFTAEHIFFPHERVLDTLQAGDKAKQNIRKGREKIRRCETEAAHGTKGITVILQDEAKEVERLDQ